MADSERIQFSPGHMLWLDPVFRFFVRKGARAVFLEGEMDWSAESINVLMPQHVGRLDGFVVRMMQRQAAPEARLVTIMLDRQLNRYPIFRWAGAVGVTPGSLDSARRLKKMVANDLVPGDFVSLFPQGRIETVDADPRRIHTGYRHFVHPEYPTRFIPVALSVEPLAHPKPTIFARIGMPVDVDQAAEAFVETVEGLRGWLRKHGETADEAWPGYRLI